MASEKLLIDANEARRRIIAFATGLHSEVLTVDTVMMLLIQMPPVDAVEVTRCRDCKFYEELNGKDSGKPVGYGYCRNPTGINGIAYEDDFCSYGERKDGDENG